MLTALLARKSRHSAASKVPNKVLSRCQRSGKRRKRKKTSEKFDFGINRKLDFIASPTALLPSKSEQAARSTAPSALRLRSNAFSSNETQTRKNVRKIRFWYQSYSRFHCKSNGATRIKIQASSKEQGAEGAYAWARSMHSSNKTKTQRDVAKIRFWYWIKSLLNCESNAVTRVKFEALIKELFSNTFGRRGSASNAPPTPSARTQANDNWKQIWSPLFAVVPEYAFVRLPCLSFVAGGTPVLRLCLRKWTVAHSPRSAMRVGRRLCGVALWWGAEDAHNQYKSCLANVGTQAARRCACRVAFCSLLRASRFVLALLLCWCDCAFVVWKVKRPLRCALFISAFESSQLLFANNTTHSPVSLRRASLPSGDQSQKLWVADSDSRLCAQPTAPLTSVGR